MIIYEMSWSTKKRKEKEKEKLKVGMLHERPGVQTSRQVDENQGIGGYQMHL